MRSNVPSVISRIRSNDRVFLVGTTGSGKTSLAEHLLANRPNLAVLDQKHQITSEVIGRRWEKVPVITSDIRTLYRHPGPHPIIYRPSIEEVLVGVPGFFAWAWERGNTVLYVDEVQGLATPTTMGVEFARCIQQGRTRGIGVWSGTQRPARIPINLISESEHDIIFRLRHKDDRERMAAFTDERILQRNPTGHGFWYYGDRDQVLRYFERANFG